jgi:hypothetical protein
VGFLPGRRRLVATQPVISRRGLCAEKSRYSGNEISTCPGGNASARGAVTFKDGAATLGTGDLDSNCQATYSTSSLALGDHSITAEYGGDANYNGSTSNTVTQTVVSEYKY